MLTSLSSQIINVVEKAAIACYDWIGKGDNVSADQAAVVSMRHTLNQMNISGKIVIGEGERDEAPMLYIGEKVGKGGGKVDIALDPLEGTTICANAGESSLAVNAFANEGGFLHAPIRGCNEPHEFRADQSRSAAPHGGNRWRESAEGPVKPADRSGTRARQSPHPHDG